MFNINFCQWLNSNRGPLELEAIALPTEPQPLPYLLSFFALKMNCLLQQEASLRPFSKSQLEQFFDK